MLLTEEESGLGVEEKGTGLWGVAGNGRDNEDVDAVLEPLSLPVPVPSPLELDPALSRKSARVGVMTSSPSKRHLVSSFALVMRALDVRPLRG